MDILWNGRGWIVSIGMSVTNLAVKVEEHKRHKVKLILHFTFNTNNLILGLLVILNIENEA